MPATTATKPVIADLKQAQIVEASWNLSIPWQPLLCYLHLFILYLSDWQNHPAISHPSPTITEPTPRNSSAKRTRLLRLLRAATSLLRICPGSWADLGHGKSHWTWSWLGSCTCSKKTNSLCTFTLTTCGLPHPLRFWNVSEIATAYNLHDIATCDISCLHPGDFTQSSCSKSRQAKTTRSRSLLVSPDLCWSLESQVNCTFLGASRIHGACWFTKLSCVVQRSLVLRYYHSGLISLRGLIPRQV